MMLLPVVIGTGIKLFMWAKSCNPADYYDNCR